MRYKSMHQPLRDHVNEAPCRAETHAGSGSHTRLLLHFSRLFILPLRGALFSLEAGVVGIDALCEHVIPISRLEHVQRLFLS
jgi:hypothetical protein